MIELAGIVVLGIVAQWFAWKLKLPAILPLILIGLVVGPLSTLFSEDGTKWIEPVWNGTEGIFPGEKLFNFVSLAIGVILFEGGMTLKRDEVLSVGSTIGKLITLGALVTFLGAGVATHYTFGLTWEISFLFSGLIIVTGPTVIAPILRNIPLRKDVASVLKWEGILIDPVGALVAVLVFEFISLEAGYEYTMDAIMGFIKILIIGISFGLAAAYAFFYIIQKKMIPHYLLNVVVLAGVIAVFVVSDMFVHESGLLSVVIMGMVLGNKDMKEVKEILYFKESLSVILISVLFILLAANINIEELLLLYRIETLLLFLVVAFVLRPISVFLSSWGSSLKFKEKIFISWVGPRGIVAAGIASLFGLKLTMMKEPGAEYITPLVFMIVLGTVLLNATTARFIARILGVFIKSSDGVIIIGASKFSRLIGKYLKDNEKRVVMIDSNPDNIQKSKTLGLEAIEGNIYDEDLLTDSSLRHIDHLYALTGSNAVNIYAIERFKSLEKEKKAHRLISADELTEKSANFDQSQLFNPNEDFINFSEVVREYPKVNELEINSKESFEQCMELINKERYAIPVFLKTSGNELHLISKLEKNLEEIEPESLLIYIGKQVVVPEEKDLVVDNS
jgi:NhaP-type Na+/H+ or K+/H+ antiporter